MPIQSDDNGTEARFLFCGDSCRLLYEELGFESALSYLFAYLRRDYPLTRIFCGFRHYTSTRYVPVADTLGGITKGIMTLATSSLTQEEIGTLMGTDRFEPYLLHADPFQDRSQMLLRQEDFASYLRVPLFAQGESIFQMAFCSNRSDAFTSQDAELFFRITRPLGESMGRTFSGQEKVFPSPTSERTHLLGMCSGLGQVFSEIKKIARSDCTVLVHGPTGAGKEVVVNTLHACSERARDPLVKVNCGAIAESLLESELFGYEKGAFTGAQATRPGLFEAANGGTIFLDEIGELPRRMQVGLLRVLDNREVTRVGSSRAIPLNIRVIAATHRDLRQMVEEGTFREDLWYRLNVYPLEIPPLREHRIDIPVLARFFANKIGQELRLSQPPYIPEDQIDALCAYDWPGNIRELRHVVERAVIRARTGNTCLPLIVSEDLKSRRVQLYPRSTAPVWNSRQKEYGLPPLPEGDSLPTLEEWTDRYVEWVLNRTGGKITGAHGAATLLGVHPNTIREKRNRILKRKNGVG